MSSSQKLHWHYHSGFLYFWTGWLGTVHALKFCSEYMKAQVNKYVNQTATFNDHINKAFRIWNRIGFILIDKKYSMSSYRSHKYDLDLCNQDFVCECACVCQCSQVELLFLWKLSIILHHRLNHFLITDLSFQQEKHVKQF